MAKANGKPVVGFWGPGPGGVSAFGGSERRESRESRGGAVAPRKGKIRAPAGAGSLRAGS